MSENAEDFSRIRDEYFYKITRRVACCLGIFLVFVGASVFVQTWLIAFKVISLDSRAFGWLLAHNVLLALIGFTLLGVSLAITLRFNRDE